MKTQLGITLAHLPRTPLVPQISIGIIKGSHHKELTELIARFALSGYFHFIVGGNWVPDQDSLRRAIRRYTTNVSEALDRPILGRPSTCLQMWDQLVMADQQKHPIFVLDFLDQFYDPDVDLLLRQRFMKRCCQAVQQLSKSKSVLILIQDHPTEAYQHFFPLLESIADEILEFQEHPYVPAIQYSLL